MQSYVILKNEGGRKKTRFPCPIHVHKSGSTIPQHTSGSRLTASADVHWAAFSGGLIQNSMSRFMTTGLLILVYGNSFVSTVFGSLWYTREQAKKSLASASLRLIIILGVCIEYLLFHLLSVEFLKSSHMALSTIPCHHSHCWALDLLYTLNIFAAVWGLRLHNSSGEGMSVFWPCAETSLWSHDIALLCPYYRKLSTASKAKGHPWVYP